MAIVFVWLLILVAGGAGGIAIGGTGYGALLGMIIALLSGIFFQLNLMHRDQKK